MMTSRRLRTLGASPNSAGLIPKSPGSSMQLYLAGAVAVLGISAFVNIKRAKTAENDNPPMGRFIEVEGVRLHVFEMGQGEPLVLLHGNGSMIEDFVSSGLVKMASSRYRVIVFDRPGYGHSSRPRNRIWTDAAQADLIQKALTQWAFFARRF